MLPNDTFDTSLPDVCLASPQYPLELLTIVGQFLQCRHHGFGGPNSGRFAANIIKHDLNKSMGKFSDSAYETS
jgi:hypothetical protein